MFPRGLLAVAVLFLGAGCFGNVSTIFPPGLEPLEPDTAPEQAGAPYTETLAELSGDSPYNWVHARGYILAPPAVVWAAAKNADVMDEGCAVDSRMVTVGLEPQYEYGFDIHYEKSEFITVDWDELWRYGTITGDAAMPRRALIRYQKVEGTTFIHLLEGSIQLYALDDDPGATMVEYIEHVDAVQASPDDSRNSVEQRFAAMLASSHGNALPACP